MSIDTTLEETAEAQPAAWTPRYKLRRESSKMSYGFDRGRRDWLVFDLAAGQTHVTIKEDEESRAQATTNLLNGQDQLDFLMQTGPQTGLIAACVEAQVSQRRAIELLESGTRLAERAKELNNPKVAFAYGEHIRPLAVTAVRRANRAWLAAQRALYHHCEEHPEQWGTVIERHETVVEGSFWRVEGEHLAIVRLAEQGDQDVVPVALVIRRLPMRGGRARKATLPLAAEAAQNWARDLARWAEKGYDFMRPSEEQLYNNSAFYGSLR